MTNQEPSVSGDAEQVNSYTDSIYCIVLWVTIDTIIQVLISYRHAVQRVQFTAAYFAVENWENLTLCNPT